MLKEILKPKNTKTKEIPLRNDNKELTKNLEYIGKLYPLIALGDFVFNPDDILNFNISYGFSKQLPVISFQLNDPLGRFKEKLKLNLDTLTIWIANNVDKFYIKSEYIVDSISPQGSSVLQVRATYNIPNFYTTTIKSYKDKTSFEVITEICKDLGLGLMSNIDNTKEKRNFIQDNIKYSTFLSRLCRTSDTAYESNLIWFVDQWGYLCVIDYKLLFEFKTPMTVSTNPATGEKLDGEYEVFLTNNLLSNDLFKISNWSILDTTTNDAKNIEISRNLLYVNDEDEKLTINLDAIKSKQNQLLGMQVYQIKKSEESKNQVSFLANDYLGRMYLQSPRLRINLNQPYLALFPSQYIPIDLYNEPKRELYDSTDSSVTSDDLRKEARNNKSIDSLYGVYNEKNSGGYIIADIQLKYFGAQSNRIDQELLVIKTTDYIAPAVQKSAAESNAENYSSETLDISKLITSINSVSSVPTANYLTLSQAGIAFLSKEEGIKLKSYLDSAGHWTIGFGNTTYENGQSVGPGEVITYQRAVSLFNTKRMQFEKTVNDAINVPITQNQFDALFSLCWNIGQGAFPGSQLVRIINSDPRSGQIPGGFTQWMWAKNKKTGLREPILLARRKRETNLYFS